LSENYELDDYVIELRNIIMRALLTGIYKDEEQVEEFMTLEYPPNPDFELLDWQAMNVLIALVEARETNLIIEDERLAAFKEAQKVIYSPCTLNPSLVRNFG
jgi:hypothetical protein